MQYYHITLRNRFYINIYSYRKDTVALPSIPLSLSLALSLSVSCLAACFLLLFLRFCFCFNNVRFYSFPFRCPAGYARMLVAQ